MNSVEDLFEIVLSINNIELKNVVNEYLEIYKEDFEKCPGSIGHHHAYTGGLLKHTLEVCDIAFSLGNNDLIISDDMEIEDNTKLTEDHNYICWDDKLIVSGLLHDVGKIKQYGFNGIKWVYKMDRETSKTYDHAVWVVNDFRTKMKQNLLPEIREAILSHHGGWTTNGAKCNNLLDTIIHSADLISSRM
jgi:hypothetical protein